MKSFVGVICGDLDAVRLLEDCRFSPFSLVSLVGVTCADLDGAKLLSGCRFLLFLPVSLVGVTDLDGLWLSGDRFLLLR